MLSSGEIAPIIMSIVAIVTAVGTLIKIHNDRKLGVQGNLLKSKEVEDSSYATLVAAQSTFSQNVMEEARAAKEQSLAATQQVADLTTQMATVFRRLDKVEYALTVYEVREGILVKHIEAGGGPPVPPLPPLPSID